MSLRRERRSYADNSPPPLAEAKTVKLSSPDRVLFPEDKITKGDVFEDKTTIEYVFVDGRKFAPEKEVHD